MTKLRKRKVEEQAILAFKSAESNEYISRYSSRQEIKDNSYEILEFMPDMIVEELSDEEYDYAVQVLLSQLS